MILFQENTRTDDNTETDDVFNDQTEKVNTNSKDIEPQKDKSENSREIETLHQKSQERNTLVKTEIKDTNTNKLLDTKITEHERLRESPSLTQKLPRVSPNNIQNEPIESVHSKNIENSSTVNSQNINGTEGDFHSSNSKLEPNRTADDEIELSLEEMVAKLDDDEVSGYEMEHYKQILLS